LIYNFEKRRFGMWRDTETANDLIGFQVHADLIRNVVSNPQMLPTTIGVFGDWGGGKTSIMKMLERDFDPENWPVKSAERKQCESTAVVYVNTWQFEGYDDAKAAILSSVLLELANHKRFGPKMRDAALKLIKSVNWMRFAKLTLKHVAVPAAAAFFTGGVAAIPAAVAISSGLSRLNLFDKKDEGGVAAETPDLSELVKKEQAESGEVDIRGFRERFGKMLKDGGIETLVVLVDDLDRCTPERIIENLEAVKLFLSADESAFIIGADRRIVEHAIREKYARPSSEGEDKELEDRLVKDYLEKLVQIPYSLPRLSATEIQTYMTLLFCQRFFKTGEFDNCLKACNAARAQNRYGSFGYADVRKAMNNAELDDPLKEALTFSASAAPLIADGLKGNPRQVKRFLNALLLRKELAKVAKLENIRDAVLVKLMILEYAHTKLFTELFNWQSQQNGHPKQLADLEDSLAAKERNYEEIANKLNALWATPAAKKWIAMEPKLKDVDLRDYFWVARDRLESTFSGIAMIPPAVRTVLDGLLSGQAPKRNAAMTAAKALTTEERETLLQLLDQRILRQPEDAAGYDAFRSLIEAGINEAAATLVEILTKRPLDKVPPALGMQITTLYNAKPELRGMLELARTQLSTSKSKVGKAYQESLKR
jgi:predicted KAP-like P-loop ATPase